ncbi:MAG: hypothetical protein ACLFRY_14410 [Spirochaetia bacterium]
MKRRIFSSSGMTAVLVAVLAFTAGGLFAQGVPPIDRNVPAPLEKATFALG